MKARRFFVLIVVFVLLFTCTAPVFAVEERGSTVYLAEIILYAAESHAFIVFKNYLNETITIGSYAVGPNKTISIGTFEDSDHDGIWYNREIYNRTSYSDCVSISYCITPDQINEIDSIIQRMNQVIAVRDSYNRTTNNCTHFAVAVWNAVGSDDIINPFDPNLTEHTNYENFKAEISDKPGYCLNAVVPYWNSSSMQVGYTNNGVFYRDTSY